MASRTRVLLCAAFVLVSCAPFAFAQTITEFPLSPVAGGNGPLSITAGPDGNLWFVEYNVSKIGRITPAGALTEFPALSAPTGITAGPDGNVWYTETAYDLAPEYISRITPAGDVTRFVAPCCENFPNDITPGPDGNLWFTQLGMRSNKLGRITTSGAITEFPIPSGSNTSGITAGPDGSLWFTAGRGNGIGRITTSGVITEFSIPTPQAGPYDIAAGPDGNLWFTEAVANKIGRITPAGVITEFAIPTPQAGLADITAGPDGNIWFTESTANKVGRITRFGVITEFPVPTQGARPFGITAGPDDALWFTESSGNKIGRITTGITPDPVQILPVVGSTAGVGASFFRTSVQLHNAGTTPSAGRIVFHPSGIPGSDSDPPLDFTLSPGQTQTIPDLLPALERSGLGSADIFLTIGSAGNIPIVSARVFNDAGAAGTTGFAFNAVTPGGALHAGRRGVLTIPLDLTNFRMNVGVRTLNAPVLMTVTVRDAAGAVAATVPKFFPATYHEQQAAGAFLNGLPLPPGGSITATVEAGSAILYGATVDNRTGDPSLQIAAPAP